MKIEYVGLLGADGELSWVSDCNSQVGDEFDGPCLWLDVEQATEMNNDFGGIPDGCRLVKVTVTITELETKNDPT
jgi:hypothetical protein